MKATQNKAFSVSRTFQYYFIMFFLSIFSVIALIIVNIFVSDIWEQFLYALFIGLGTYLTSRIMAKILGRQAIKSKRAFIQKILIIIIKSLIFATSFIALITTFLIPDMQLIVTIEGIRYVNLDYLTRYLIIYIMIYAITYILTAVLVNN